MVWQSRALGSWLKSLTQDTSSRVEYIFHFSFIRDKLLIQNLCSPECVTGERKMLIADTFRLLNYNHLPDEGQLDWNLVV